MRTYVGHDETSGDILLSKYFSVNAYLCTYMSSQCACIAT